MTNFNTVPIEDLYESTLQSDLGETDMVAKTVKIITGTLTGGATTYMGINYDRPSKYELIEISAINGQDVTIVTRALPTKSGGTGTAQNHPAGSKVIITHNYKVFEDIQTAVNSKADASAPTIDEPTFTDWVKLPSYANAAARDVAIPTPQKDMTVILDNDGDGKRCLTLYSGSAWTNITLPGRNVTIDGFLIVAGGYVRFPVYANDAARNAAIPTPVQSMVVYNQAAVTLQLYDGANWINLDIGTPVPLATTTVAGRSRLATNAQVLSKTDSVSGEPLVVQPSQLDLAGSLQVVSGVAMTAGQLVGVYNGITNTNPIVGPAVPPDSVLIKQSLPNSGTEVLRVLNISGNDYLVLYRATNELRGVVATFNGTTLTYATSILISSDVTNSELADLALLSSTRAVVNYAESAALNVLRHRVISISGTTLTQAAVVTTFTASSNILGVQNCSPTTNLGAVSIACTTNTHHRTMAYTLSGTTLTVGAAVTIFSGISFTSSSLVSEKIRSDAYAISFNADILACSISGTTVTAGSPFTWGSGGSTFGLRIVYMSDNNIVLQSRDNANPELTAFTVSGTTFTAGTNLTSLTNFSPIIRLSSTLLGVENGGTYTDYTYSAGTLTLNSTIYSGRTTLLDISNGGGNAAKKGDFVLASNLGVLSLVSIPTIYYWAVTGMTTAVNSANVIGVTTAVSAQGATTFISLRGKLINTPGATRNPGSLYRITNGAEAFVPATTNVSAGGNPGQFQSLCNKFTAVTATDLIFT